MEGFIPGVRFCEVIDVTDYKDLDMVRARIHPEDDSKKDSELPYAFPLLPKQLHVKPKVGEGVLIMLAMTNDGESQRYYIGPVISQDNKLFEEKFDDARSFMKGATNSPGTAPSTNPDIVPILPKDNEVVVRGRKNADIRITDDDVKIEAGVKKVTESKPEEMKFNSQDPAYMKLKYHPGGLIKNGEYEGETQQCNSTATIIADKINLLGNNSPIFKPSNTCKDNENKEVGDLITDDELKRAIDEAEQLPYGKKLVELLNLFIDAFVNHTHPFMMKTQTIDGTPTKQLLEKKAQYLDNKEILSKNIRIN